MAIYWRCNSGGWNKSHGTVENVPRIDSFDSAISEGGGSLFVCANGITKLLDFDRYTDYGSCPGEDREIVELWAGEWSQALELSHKVNGYGGQQTFFRCPACGGRARYLYQAGATFLCRKCSRLNYRSQQEARSGSMYYYDKGIALVEKHLDTWTQGSPDGFGFCGWIPDRPRYMHQTTYRRYLARLFRYEEKHAGRQIEDMQRILNMLEG